MAITLLIEDGSIVANANSFIDLPEARTQCEALGLILSVDDDIARSQLTQGYYQLKRSYQSRLKGCLVSASQTGIYPREDVYANGFEVPEDSIPQDVINAQLAYAHSINEGNSVNNTASEQELSSFSVKGGLYTESYKPGSSKRTTPFVPAVTQWLQPYMKSNSLSRDDPFYDGRGTGLYRGVYVR